MKIDLNEEMWVRVVLRLEAFARQHRNSSDAGIFARLIREQMETDARLRDITRKAKEIIRRHLRL